MRSALHEARHEQKDGGSQDEQRRAAAITEQHAGNPGGERCTPEQAVATLEHRERQHCAEAAHDCVAVQAGGEREEHALRLDAEQAKHHRIALCGSAADWRRFPASEVRQHIQDQVDADSSGYSSNDPLGLNGTEPGEDGVGEDGDGQDQTGGLKNARQRRSGAKAAEQSDLDYAHEGKRQPCDWRPTGIRAWKPVEARPHKQVLEDHQPHRGQRQEQRAGDFVCGGDLGEVDKRNNARRDDEIQHLLIEEQECGSDDDEYHRDGKTEDVFYFGKLYSNVHKNQK